MTATDIPSRMTMNIDRLIARVGAVDEGKPLMTDLAGRRVSSPQFAKRVRELAGGLSGLGLEPGAKVGLLALNSIEYAEVMCGTICAGMVSVPLNLRWSPKELAYAVEDAGIEILIADDTFLPAVAAVTELTGRLKAVYHFGKAERPETVKDYGSLFGNEAELVLDRNPMTECLISYTGGTTGFPKGVVHTHASLMAGAVNMASGAVPTKGMSYLIGVPMFHVGGFGFLFSRLLQNDTLAIVPLFRPDLVIQAVKTLDIDEIGLVPTMLQMLLADPGFDKEDFKKIRRIYYGASPISKALLRAVMETFEGVELVQVYGMTEVGVAVVLAPQFHAGPLARQAAAGQACALAQIRIEDDQGNEVPVGGHGEVVFYGPSLMRCYHNKPEETAATFRNGGLRSGDAGYMDELGVIFLLDRVKDMIVTGGENVYSAEVESALSTHPEVAQVAVIGVPHEKYGEAVHAVIVPKEGKEPSFESIRNHAHERIAGYKCPQSMELAEALPLSAMNKVLKNELRKPHWEGKSRAIN